MGQLLRAAALLGCCAPPEYVSQVLPLLYREVGGMQDVAAAVQQVVAAVQRGAGVMTRRLLFCSTFQLVFYCVQPQSCEAMQQHT